MIPINILLTQEQLDYLRSKRGDGVHNLSKYIRSLIDKDRNKR